MKKQPEPLEAKLNLCPSSDQRDQARLAVEHAKQTSMTAAATRCSWRILRGFDIEKVKILSVGQVAIR